MNFDVDLTSLAEREETILGFRVEILSLRGGILFAFSIQTSEIMTHTFIQMHHKAQSSNV